MYARTYRVRMLVVLLSDLNFIITNILKPLLAHVCRSGSNENEAALDWFNETITYRDRYLVDYVKLYFDTVRECALHTRFVSVICACVHALV